MTILLPVVAACVGCSLAFDPSDLSAGGAPSSSSTTTSTTSASAGTQVASSAPSSTTHGSSSSAGASVGDGATTVAATSASTGAGCAYADLGSATPVQQAGSTLGQMGNDYTPPVACTGNLLSTAPEDLYVFHADADRTYTIRGVPGTNFDLAVYVYDGVCPAPDAPLLGCVDTGGNGDPDVLALPLVTGQTITIVIDGYKKSTGLYAVVVE